jgi:hypothetical protein
MTRWLILGALLACAAGCGTRYAAISPPASPNGDRLLTFIFGGGLVLSGCQVVLFDDGDVEYEGWGLLASKGRDGTTVAPSAIATVRSNLERLSALPPDSCDCGGPTDQSMVTMIFRPAGGAELRTFHHYFGCNQTPDWVYDAENEIDAALEIGNWLGRKVDKPFHRRQQD